MRGGRPPLPHSNLFFRYDNPPIAGPPRIVAQRSRALASLPRDWFAEYNDSKPIATTARSISRSDASTEAAPFAVAFSFVSASQGAARRLLASLPLPGLFGNDEPEKEVHDLPDAEQPEERESDPDQGPIQAEELRQATTHAGKEPV